MFQLRASTIFIYPVVCHRQNLDNPYMCYEFRTPTPPPPPSSSLANSQLIQAAQTIRPECDLHAAVSKPVTSYRIFMLLAPLIFVPASHTPVVKVRLVVWRSDLIRQGGRQHVLITQGSYPEWNTENNYAAHRNHGNPRCQDQ